MAKIKKPLMSVAASGNFAQTIQFICGRFVRGIPAAPSDRTTNQEVQNEKFLEGATTWTNILSFATKNKWRSFVKIVKQQPQCVETTLPISGYNLWQLYYVKFGPEGWEEYPDPPTS